MMCEECLRLQSEVDWLKKSLSAGREEFEGLGCEIDKMTADLRRARAVAREYGFTATEDDSAEGLVRNILTVLQSERQKSL